MRKNKGITLVALVVTIIVLLILAAVSINLVLGENGIITRTKQARKNHEEKTLQEQEMLAGFEDEMNGKIDNEEIENLLLERIDIHELAEDVEDTEMAKMKIKINVSEEQKNIALPISLDEKFEYNCMVDWGDNASQMVKTENIIGPIIHTYAQAGIYTMIISGKCESFYSAYGSYSILNELMSIEQWGNTGLKDIDVYGCQNLTEVPSPSRNSFIKIENFYGFFEYCSELTTIPENLFANCPNVKSFESAFKECRKLNAIPEKLFANCLNVENFERTFKNCESLTSIPENLFANCKKVKSFNETFARCSNLTGKAIELWAEGRKGIDNNHGGYGCYFDCYGLDDYENIPQYWIYVKPE